MLLRHPFTIYLRFPPLFDTLFFLNEHRTPPPSPANLSAPLLPPIQHCVIGDLPTMSSSGRHGLPKSTAQSEGASCSPPLSYNAAMAGMASKSIQLSRGIGAASSQVWRMPTLRLMQLDLTEIVLDPERSNVVVAVYLTGSGKTHVIRVVGVIERGSSSSPSSRCWLTS